MNEYDELGAFFAWWYQKRPFMPPTIGEVVSHTPMSTSAILYRSGQFQVQHVIYRPDSEAVDHKHPHVDSILVYGSGDVTFRRNDETPIVCVNPGQDIMRIKPEDWHGVTFGPRGGSFYAIQRWDCLPGFVIDDWVFRNPQETRKNHSNR